MADYKRVPVDPQKPLGTGMYEIVLIHQRGDPSKVTRSSLEKALQKQYGSGVRVLDWGKRGGDLVIRLEVKGTSTSPAPSSSAMAGEAADYIYPALLPALPVVLTAVALMTMLSIVWGISTQIKETVKLIPEPARSVAASGTGIGVAAAGVALLVFAVSEMRRRKAQ
jgi:hypothetical protein